MKKRVLVVHPTRYDRPSLLRTALADRYELIWYDESTDPALQISAPGVGPLTVNIAPEVTLQELRTIAHEHNIDGIMSAQDYPGNILASLVAQERNLVAPSPLLVTGFQHKLYSRRLQQLYVPHVTPRFWVVSPHQLSGISSQLLFPLFIKPVKANFSIFAQPVLSAHDLGKIMGSQKLPSDFIDQFDWYANTLGIMAESADCYIAEELLKGVQVTLEGFVANGKVTIVGIVDSIMYPGTICFERFVYPSELPAHVQQHMQDAATILMNNSGYNNGFFNIEFMYNPVTEQIAIIEINPRMSSQFADLYEKVDGINTYHLLLELAVGSRPTLMVPKGPFAVAASCVLRVFEDKKVLAIPTVEQIQQVKEQFPYSEVFIKVVPGQRLSDIEQDGKSFAYALIHLGGNDRNDIDQKLIQCKKILSFNFSDSLSN